MAELQRVAPAYAWHQVWSSGRHLPDDVGAAVLGAWQERLEDLARDCSRDPGNFSAPGGLEKG